MRVQPKVGDRIRVMTVGQVREGRVTGFDKKDGDRIVVFESGGGAQGAAASMWAPMCEVVEVLQTRGEEFHDVDVAPAEAMGVPMEGPFVVVLVDGQILSGLSEEAACRYQRVHRLAAGRDAMSGDPIEGGVDDLTRLYAMWDELGDVAVNEDGTLAEPFLHFSAGEAQREDVWRWFEKAHPSFSVSMVQQGIRVQQAEAS